MALVNTAHVLALEGWRVLLVDFDLEAPGMTHFFAQDVRHRPSYVRKDSLDLLLDAKRSLINDPQSNIDYPRSLAEYVVPLALPPSWKEELPSGIPYRNGRLDLIPATLETRRLEGSHEEPPPDYIERLGELDLASLFESGGPGHRFGDHVRKHFVSARFEAPGDILFALHDPVQAAYDVVLIDSRTGLNEIAGISIGTVADALVICCGLNQQNVEGTRYFMKKTGLFNRKRAKPYIVAVGPVPPWLTPEAEERLRVLQRALRLRRSSRKPIQGMVEHVEGVEEASSEDVGKSPEFLEIPYHPLAAIRETIFVKELPRDPITQAYITLARRIRSRLLHGTPETVERQSNLRKILFQPNLETLESFCGFTAVNLPQLRLPRYRRPDPIPLFPSACGITSLPSRRGEIRWGDLGRIAVAAAVSASYTLSAAHFDRAWEFLPALTRNEHQQFLARCLIFFQCSSSHVLPEERLVWLSGYSEGELRDEQRLLSDLCAYMVERKLQPRYPDRTKEGEVGDKNREILMASATRMSSWRLFRSGIRLGHPRGSMRDTVVGLVSAVEQLVDGTLQKNPETLRFLNDLYRLPATPSEILRGRFIRSSAADVLFDRSTYANIPVGFWPEPLAATALVAAEGTRAVDKVLAWIYLARLHYGYSWRVLVDWRYFDAVREHAKFQAFLRQEEEFVAAIEKRIDSGDLPL
jgi:cellulose biosynthesis protein BcsQ